MTVTIDNVFMKIGQFRQYQWYLLMITGYLLLTATFATMIVTFVAAEPDWKCVEGYMNNTVCRFNESITLTSDDYEARCEMPREAWTFVNDFTSTVTEYDLVCDDSILLSIAQSSSWAGMLAALLVGGVFADNFGRRITAYAGVFLMVLATWVIVFPKSFVVFIVCRVFIGLGTGFQNCSIFPMLTEFTTERYRSWMGAGYFQFWAVATSLLPLIAYLIPAWRTFLLVTAIAAVPVLGIYWLILESPRWLLSKGREEEAVTVLGKVSKMNKRSLPDDLVLQKPLLLHETRVSCLQLFSGWKTAKKTLISWDLWFANALVYFGVSYGSVDLGGSRYLNVFLISVVDIPSNFAYIWSSHRFGRKTTVIIPMIVAFVASAISVSIPTNKSSASVGGRVATAMIAKFFINFSFSGIYVWCVELYPTVVRATAISSSSTFARLGSFSASYIIWLIRYHAALPYSIMGAICLQAAILGLFLPETKGEPTLETMDDMNKDEGIALRLTGNGKAEDNESENEEA